jgi:CMP-N-acetylneuraminate monooxygenase
MSQFERYVIPLKFDRSNDHATHHRIGNLNVWVCVSNSELNVFFDECAHMGGALFSNGKNLVCRHHGWSYDFNGRNSNRGAPNLRKAKVLETTGSSIEVLLPSKAVNFVKTQLEHPLKIKVHSHATLELNYRGDSLIFDPWLEGPAYYGAWHLQPKPVVSVQEIKVNAIIITHPHPDHFHISTLEKMDKSLAIYFPQFPSQIIEDGLNDLGFTNQFPVFWGETFSIGSHIKSKFLKPRSMWEDSATYTWIEDKGTTFNWLNLVDAGSVIDEYALPDLDLMTSAFDQGASGYPLTWTHLSESRQVKMLKAQKISTLNLLPARAKKLNVKYFLPFAGHWRLGLEEHEKYAKLIPHTTFQEISDSFLLQAPHTEFLGLYPGDSFDFLNKTTNRNVKENSEGKKEGTELKSSFINFQATLSQDLLASFRIRMSNLTNQGEAFGCEKVSFKVSTTQGSFSEIFKFYSSRTVNNQKIDIEVVIPEHILALLAEGNANWDHVAIGYWGTWTRNPDVYPANFMRLLQAANAKSTIRNNLSVEAEIQGILHRTVGDIIEADEIDSPKLLSRLGLPCISCIRSNSETLEQAMDIHNIDIESSVWILRELASKTLARLAT